MMTTPSRLPQASALLVLVFSVLGLAIPSPGQDLKFELDNPLIQLEDPAAVKSPKQPAGKQVEVALKPAKGKIEDLKPGDLVTLSITINVPTDSYTYSMTTPAGGKTRFTLSKTDGLEEVDEKFTPERKPKEVSVPDFGLVEKFEKTITWNRNYKLAGDASVKDVLVEGSVRGQICDESTCKIVSQKFAAVLGSPQGANTPTFRTRPNILGKPGPAVISAKLSPENAEPGDKVTLTVSMELDEGWHTYSITQKPNNAATKTNIEIAKHRNLKPVGDGFTPDKKFTIKKEDVGFAEYVQEVHDGVISWSRDFVYEADSEDAGFGVAGKITYQTCDKDSCLLPKTVAFELDSVAGVSQVEPADEAEDGEELDLDSIASPGQDVKKQGLALFLVSAAGFGFLALLTPCVFPMVPITISFFLKQSETSHHRPTTLALVYCGGIIATFTGLGLLMAALFEATALNQLANNEWLNLVLAAVIILFGISMLGVFEIRVPSWLLTWSAGKESKGGIVGTLFMALTFTLVSFTCTFAFAGLLLVMASKGEVIWPVLGMLAFSAAFSFPFFLLALFPGFLKKLPKSGGWMNTVKVTMGFIEIGAALKFLSVADTSFFGQPKFLTYEIVMFGWLIFAALTAGYLLGLFRMPHDMPAKLTWKRAVFAVPFLALAVLIGVGTTTDFHPTGVTKKVWQNVVAFAPIQSGEVGNDPNIGPWRKSHGIVYSLSFEQAVKHAQRTNRPLLLDFTGVNCVNCRKMESVIGDAPDLDRLQSFVTVQLYTDEIPNADQSGLEDAETVESMLEMNRKLQRQWFGDVQLPAYAVVHPQDLTVLKRFTGLTSEYAVFDEFLAEGLDKWSSHDPTVKPAQNARANETAQRM